MICWITWCGIDNNMRSGTMVFFGLKILKARAQRSRSKPRPYSCTTQTCYLCWYMVVTFVIVLVIVLLLLCSCAPFIVAGAWRLGRDDADTTTTTTTNNNNNDNDNIINNMSVVNPAQIWHDQLYYDPLCHFHTCARWGVKTTRTLLCWTRGCLKRWRAVETNDGTLKHPILEKTIAGYDQTPLSFLHIRGTTQNTPTLTFRHLPSVRLSDEIVKSKASQMNT